MNFSVQAWHSGRKVCDQVLRIFNEFTLLTLAAPKKPNNDRTIMIKYNN